MTDVTPYPKAPRERGSALYRAARRSIQARSQGRCEARIEGICTGIGVLAHHVRRRSQGGGDIAQNLLWLDDACHTWIHAHPAESVELGFLARSTFVPESSAVVSVERVTRG